MPFAGPIWGRALNIAKSCLVAAQAHRNDSNIEVPDMDYVVVSLDLISGIIQGLGPSAAPLIQASNPPIHTLIGICLQPDTATDVQISAFALLGDLAINTSSLLLPHIPELMPLILNGMHRSSSSLAWSSPNNNATWAMGEIAIRYQSGIHPYIPHILERTIPTLSSNDITLSLAENISILLGRLGLVAAELVAPHLGLFVLKFLVMLGKSGDNLEKESAFSGMCNMIVINPNAMTLHLQSFCDAVTRWKQLDPHLKSKFKQVILNLDRSWICM